MLSCCCQVIHFNWCHEINSTGEKSTQLEKPIQLLSNHFLLCQLENQAPSWSAVQVYRVNPRWWINPSSCIKSVLTGEASSGPSIMYILLRWGSAYTQWTFIPGCCADVHCRRQCLRRGESVRVGPLRRSKRKPQTLVCIIIYFHELIKCNPAGRWVELSPLYCYLCLRRPCLLFCTRFVSCLSQIRVRLSPIVPVLCLFCPRFESGLAQLFVFHMSV